MIWIFRWRKRHIQVGVSENVSGNEPYTDNNEETQDVTVFTPKGYVLLVDGDKGKSYETYFEDTLLADSYLYDLWNRDTDGSI